MPLAYNQALAAGQSLLEGAGNLCEDPVSLDAQSLLVTAAQGVLEGTVKVRVENNRLLAIAESVQNIGFGSSLAVIMHERIAGRVLLQLILCLLHACVHV